LSNIKLSPEEYLRNNISWIEIDSVIDVGTGHSGVFDYGRFQSYDLSYKACLDVYYFRPDIDRAWHRILASATHLPLKDGCFDHVQSTEMMEHIRSDYHRLVLKELKRIARKCVFLTATGLQQHLGPEQIMVEDLNPFNKYQDTVSKELLEDEDFEILDYFREKVENDKGVKFFEKYAPGSNLIMEHVKAFYEHEMAWDIE